MATKATRIEVIVNALGEPWAATRARFEAAGGEGTSHRDLAEALYLQFDGTVENHGWWVQGADGSFEGSMTKTVAGVRSEVVEAWAQLVGEGPINGFALDAAPRRSETAKRSFWRADLERGVKLEAAGEAKGEDRTVLVVTVAKLPSAEALEQWRGTVKELLAQV